MARRIMGKSMDQEELLYESISASKEESSSSIGSASLDSSSCFSDSNDDDDGDEASSSSSSSSSSSASSSSTLIAKNMNDDESPLYQLSVLMAQLPIKRGLSSFYQGKSQSYTSLGSVKSLEDLVKKIPSRRKVMQKSKCKSFCVGLDRGRHCYGPKPGITKKGSSSRGSCLSSLARTSVRAATCFE